MNKKVFFLFFLPLFLWPSILSAQFVCDPDRYLHPVFDSVKLTRDVVYGKNGDDLLLDVYEPLGDSLTERPLLVLAFGGAFVFGNRQDDYMIEMAYKYALRGYVVASIDYRLSPVLIFNSSDKNYYTAVIKAVHDMRASIRYFRKEVAAQNNAFRIDTSLIYAGGVSAGAIVGVHTAYMRDIADFPAVIDTAGIGGVEGLSGNPGYSSEVAGVINLCGAIGDSSWIDLAEAPMLSMHGDVDSIVPYGSDTVTVFGANLPVDGSASMNQRIQNLGGENPFKTWVGAGHTPFIMGFTDSSALYMDTVMSFTSTVLHDWLCAYYGALTPVDPELAPGLSVRVFPNPARNQVRIQTDQANGGRKMQLELYDLSGRKMHTRMEAEQSGYILHRSGLPPGYYILSISDRQHGRFFYEKILFQ